MTDTLPARLLNLLLAYRDAQQVLCECQPNCAEAKAVFVAVSGLVEEMKEQIQQYEREQQELSSSSAHQQKPAVREIVIPGPVTSMMYPPHGEGV